MTLGDDNIVGARRARTFTIGFDSSYPTGGEELKLATLGLEEVLFVAQEGAPIVVNYDRANEKLLAYWGTGGTAGVLPQVTNATDLSAQTVRVQFVGR